MGITFNVYGEDTGTERIFPFDIIPRVVEAGAWDRREQGLSQRIRALHLFIDDVYHERRIVSGGIVPTESETMEHGETWHFSQLGRFIERADQTSRVLDVQYGLLLPSAADVGKPVDDLQWSALLRSTSGFEPYRRAYGRVASETVVGFLLFDLTFPRSVITTRHKPRRRCTRRPAPRLDGS